MKFRFFLILNFPNTKLMIPNFCYHGVFRAILKSPFSKNVFYTHFCRSKSGPKFSLGNYRVQSKNADSPFAVAVSLVVVLVRIAISGCGGSSVRGPLAPAPFAAWRLQPVVHWQKGLGLRPTSVHGNPYSYGRSSPVFSGMTSFGLFYVITDLFTTWTFNLGLDFYDIITFLSITKNLI